MKRNMTFAMILLTGCVCAWSYLAAQSNGGNATPPEITTPSSLLEIKEPSHADFELCAKRAVDFMESWSEEQAKMDIAVHELYDTADFPPQLAGMTNQLTYMKKEIAFGRPELITKKSLGENVIVMYYNYCTDKWPMYCRFVFERTFDQNGEPLKWQCRLFVFGSDIDRIIPTW